MKIIADCAIPFLEDVLTPFAEVVRIAGKAITAADVRDADALIVRTRTRCDARLLAGSRVRMIATATIGFDHIDLGWCAAHGIRVTTAAGCNARGVLQWIGAALVHLARVQGWQPDGRTLGIVGVGHVGSLVKEYAEAWGFRVLCCDPPREERERLGFLPLEEVAAQADLLTFHTPLDETTRHLADERLLGMLRPDAVVINTSRGEVVDGEALVRSGHPCALDVWEHEPAIDRTLLDRALTTDTELKARQIEVKQTGALFKFSGGDARKLLNILDILAGATEGKLTITDQYVTDCLQQNIALYDKNGEQHYDVISAFIKSVRGSDPNAAIYYLARMLAGGEEPRFIARRLVILASEDIGLANPNALLLANACFDTVHKIGMPEARITLAETTIYLATSPKSNSAYAAINKAIALVEHDTTNRPVPLHLRNAPTRLMEREGYGKGYKYAHDYEGHFAELEFLPESLSGTKFYEPDTQNAAEAKIAERIHALWKEKYR